jgi:putative hydrolase of the HAD superfamily
MSYKAIGFDWGGVLNGQPKTFLVEKILALLDVSHDDYLRAYFNHNKKVNRGEVTWDELWQLVLTELGQPEKTAQVAALTAAANEDNINPEVLALVDRLKATDYKVGMLSNNTFEKGKHLRKVGLDKHFDVFHISAETGLVKPEPEAFQHFAEALGVTLPELIFIDDSTKSLSTAEECGFTPILFESYQQLASKLEDLGIQTKA